MNDSPPDKPDRYDALKRALAAIAFGILITGLVALIWLSNSVWLVVFAGILLGVLLDGLTRLTMAHTPLPRLPALIVVIVALAAILGGFGWFTGPRLAEQSAQFQKRVSQAVENVQQKIERTPWIQKLVSQLPKPEDGASLGPGMITSLFSSIAKIVGGATNVLVVLIVGIYLAADPGYYTRGVTRLFPKHKRDEVRTIFYKTGHALRWWLVGQFSSMTVIGILSFIGLWIAGVPLAFSLAVIAGLLSFVPFLGPIVSMIPAALVAASDAPVKIFYVVLVFIAVQFLEGNFITPLIQLRAVSLPPVVLITAQILMGVLFGIFSVLLAAPLAVVIMALVQLVYIRGVLNDPIDIVGEHTG